VVAPTSPTHYPDNKNHQPDILDKAIVKTGSLNYQLTNSPEELSSDHTPTQLDIQTRASRGQYPVPSWITNWNEFHLYMN